MGDVAYVRALLLIEALELEHPLLYADGFLESGIVHALGASEGPAVFGFGFAMVVVVLWTCCVNYGTIR